MKETKRKQWVVYYRYKGNWFHWICKSKTLANQFANNLHGHPGVQAPVVIKPM